MEDNSQTRLRDLHHTFVLALKETSQSMIEPLKQMIGSIVEGENAKFAKKFVKCLESHVQRNI